MSTFELEDTKIENRKNPLKLTATETFKIFLFLDPISLQNVCSTCWYWRKINSQTNLWKKAFLEQNWRKETNFYCSLKDQDDEKLKNFFLYRRYLENLYSKEKVYTLKHFNQMDLKIMMLQNNMIQKIEETSEWNFVDYEDDFEKSPIITVHEVATNTGMKKIENLLNFECNQFDEYDNEWIDCGYIIGDVLLRNGYVFVNVQKNQKMRGKSYIRRFIYDLMLFEQKSIPGFVEYEQFVSEVSSFSSEYGGKYLAQNIVGTPNNGTWAPFNKNSDFEFLELKFARAIFVKEIHIYESVRFLKNLTKEKSRIYCENTCTKKIS